MTRRAKFDPDGIFATLVSHEVDFVLIGGLAGVAQGAPWPTMDADVVIATEDDNLVRLDGALRELAAEREQPNRG